MVKENGDTGRWLQPVLSQSRVKAGHSRAPFRVWWDNFMQFGLHTRVLHGKSFQVIDRPATPLPSQASNLHLG